VAHEVARAQRPDSYPNCHFLFPSSGHLTPQSANTAGPAKFEAASIKLDKSGNQVMAIPLDQPGGHVMAVNATLRFLIITAYDLPFLTALDRSLIVGIPNLMEAEHFDIEAETPGNPSEAEKRLMLQSLLADRFGLVLHHETRQLPAFSLVMAKNGELGRQLQPHSADAKCVDTSGVHAPPSASEALPVPCNNVMVMPTPWWRLSGGNVSMQELSSRLFRSNLDSS
jgi:uncharacterized protein (TIGR03435 family)